jgi:hypothetical protein
MVSLGGGRAWKQQGGGTRRNRPTTPIFSISQGQVSLPQSARRPVPPHRLVATLPQPSCIYFISIVCDRPNAASGLRRVQALGELARAWFVHILRASSIARFRATEPARSSKSKSPGWLQIIDSKPVKICGFNFQDHKPLNTHWHALSLQTSGGGPRRERCLCRSSPACQQQSRYRSRWPP